MYSLEFASNLINRYDNKEKQVHSYVQEMRKNNQTTKVNNHNSYYNYFKNQFSDSTKDKEQKSQEKINKLSNDHQIKLDRIREAKKLEMQDEEVRKQGQSRTKFNKKLIEQVNDPFQKPEVLLYQDIYFVNSIFNPEDFNFTKNKDKIDTIIEIAKNEQLSEQEFDENTRSRITSKEKAEQRRRSRSRNQSPMSAESSPRTYQSAASKREEKGEHDFLDRIQSAKDRKLYQQTLANTPFSDQEFYSQYKLNLKDKTKVSYAFTKQLKLLNLDQINNIDSQLKNNVKLKFKDSKILRNSPNLSESQLIDIIKTYENLSVEYGKTKISSQKDLREDMTIKKKVKHKFNLSEDKQQKMIEWLEKHDILTLILRNQLDSLLYESSDSEYLKSIQNNQHMKETVSSACKKGRGPSSFEPLSKSLVLNNDTGTPFMQRTSYQNLYDHTIANYDDRFNSNLFKTPEYKKHSFSYTNLFTGIKSNNKSNKHSLEVPNHRNDQRNNAKTDCCVQENSIVINPSRMLEINSNGSWIIIENISKHKEFAYHVQTKGTFKIKSNPSIGVIKPSQKIRIETIFNSKPNINNNTKIFIEMASYKSTQEVSLSTVLSFLNNLSDSQKYCHEIDVL